jgi:hypothetical protein
MATLATSDDASGKVKFGIPADENGLVTHKISVSKKVEKKDLRGRNGGYRAIMSYNKTFEVSIESVLASSGTSPYALGTSHTLEAANNVLVDLPAGIPLVIEEVTVDFKNDDFAKVNVKLFGYEQITNEATPVP